LTEATITIRKTGRTWIWRCTNDNCGWIGIVLSSQQAALREACRHLVDTFDRHHGMVETSPHWNETEQRARATCHCGYEVEEKSENGAEYAIEMHAQWLRETLPGCAEADTCPRCPHPAHGQFCGVTEGINCCGCTGNVIPN
jgi:hypothetical protein